MAEPNEMDFNQAAVKCVYPLCREARAFPDALDVQPFCEAHLRKLNDLLFEVWVMQHVQVRPNPSALTVPKLEVGRR